MEKSTVIGVVLGFVSVGVGMVLKGAHLSSLLNYAAFLIIIGGTAAAVLIAFPMSELAKIPKLFRIIFSFNRSSFLRRSSSSCSLNG